LTITVAYTKAHQVPRCSRKARADKNEIFVSLILTLSDIEKKGGTSHIYIDISNDFTEKIIHTQFILKKLIFFLDNNWQED
jgi:hypothetical protein